MSNTVKDLKHSSKTSEKEDKTPDISSSQQALQRVENLLNKLTVFSRMVLRMRYGLETGQQMSYEEISDFLQIRASRIKELEHVALRHLAYKKKEFKC